MDTDVKKSKTTRKKIIIGNWKMNPSTVREALALYQAVKKMPLVKNVDVALAAPFVYLPALAKLAGARLALAAQNVSAEKEGPFTGEVSARMLKAQSVSYCIVGHSERRKLGETNSFINKKIQSLLATGITPVLCIGEEERDQGMWYLSTIKTQLEECLKGVSKASLAKLIIAYEPVWAISSTPGHRDASPEDCHEMIIYIRKVLADLYDPKAPQTVRIIYGGSVDEKNAGDFLSKGFAEGLLPGKASLTPKKFISIITIANDIR